MNNAEITRRLNELDAARLPLSPLMDAFATALGTLDQEARRAGLRVTNKWRAERLSSLVFNGLVERARDPVTYWLGGAKRVAPVAGLPAFVALALTRAVGCFHGADWAVGQ